MSTDRLGHQPRLRRPTAAIGWVAGLHLVSTLPLTAINLDESWRHPLAGLSIWMFLWLIWAVPLTAIATVLAVRMERAATGIDHPSRFAWLGVSLGAILAAHWFWHLFWAPAYLFWAATSGYRTEEHLLGAFLALLAWGFFVAGVTVARLTGNRMRARDWSELEPSPAGSRWLTTPLLGAMAYIAALFPLQCGVAVFTVEESIPVLVVLVWTVMGLGLAGAGAAWGTWAGQGMAHGAPVPASGARFRELFGLGWIAHWALPWLLLVVPIHRTAHHDERLVASLLIAGMLMVGTAVWSYGRTAARASVQPAG